MVQVLLALAILIAVLGVVNTLALSVLERTRELGLLRAVGLGRGQTMRMVTVEAVVISVFGALLGVVVGAGLGAAVVRALDGEGITDLVLPWTGWASTWCWPPWSGCSRRCCRRSGRPGSTSWLQ